MTTNVVAIGPDASYREMISALRRHRVSGLPVVDAEGIVVGLVSETDLLARRPMADRPGWPPHRRHVTTAELTAGDLMTEPVVTIGPDDTLNTAYARMKLYDVSQLPVLEADRVVGVIDESDLLMAIFADPSHFADCARSAMSTRVETVPVTAALKDLLAVFDRGHVVIVVEGKQFLGLITRIDLVNYLRRKVG